jgi:hypothetical protein
MFLSERLTLIENLRKYLIENNEDWQNIQQDAHYKNPWFTPTFITKAINNIVTAFLEPTILNNFCEKYYLNNQNNNFNPKLVGVVMAGNIPLVGFHDFLCVFLSGHRIKLKLSSKDDVLLKYIIKLLHQWEPKTIATIEIADMLKDCDAYIATGGGNTGNYFEYYFGKYPNIIRRNRTSVALLNGNESPEDLTLLAQDIHEYFGLGCRSVTKLYVPKNYNFIPLIEACKTYLWMENVNSWKNNYDYQLSILLLNNTYYMSTGCLLITESVQLFSSIAQIHYSYYDNENKVIKELEENNQIQVIVNKNSLPFGSTQSPNIYQYADGIDTMAFLTSL